MSRLNRIGRYDVDEVLEEDPSGRIVRARDTRLDRTVLIREQIPPPGLSDLQQAGRLAAFQREAAALARAGHAVIEPPCDIGDTEAESCYLVYPRPDARWQPLSAVERSLTPEDRVRITAELAQALGAAAGAGMTASAFFPDEIFLGTGGAVKWLPLRLGCETPLPDPTQPDPYAPPERATPNQPSLVYALAAWLYLGLAPSAEPPREAAARGEAPPPLWTVNPSVRAAVDEALQKALQRDPRRRYQALEDFAGALRPQAPSPVKQPEAIPTKSSKSEPSSESPWVAYGTCGAGIVVAGTLTGWALAQLFPAR
jgi:serine/threonine protein kinase